MQLIYAMLIGAALFLSAPPAWSQELPQSPLNSPAAQTLSYPKVVLYSVSWCPHCKRAKEYLTANNIPFINRDVELDADAMRLLTEKYHSQSVPVIVLGEDEVVLRGFDEARFQEAVEKLKQK